MHYASLFQQSLNLCIYNVYVYTHTHTHTHTYIYIYILHGSYVVNTTGMQVNSVIIIIALRKIYQSRKIQRVETPEDTKKENAKQAA